MKSIVALTSLALVSFSSVAPCLAATQAISRSTEQALPSQVLPNAAKTTLVAGFNFGGLINQGLDIVKQEQLRKEEEERKAQQEKERQERLEAQKKQQEERAAAAKREADLEKQRLSTQPSTSLRQNNSQSADNLHQVLKKRGNETYEQWYKRINPIIMRMPGTEYRAWKATLSVQDKQAYDAIVRRKNHEAADRLDTIIPTILQDAAASQNPTRCWAGTPEQTLRRCPPGSY